MSKKCNKCGEVKELTDFYKQTNLLKVVNGEASITQISNEISGLIEGIKGWLWEIRQYKYAVNKNSLIYGSNCRDKYPTK